LLNNKTIILLNLAKYLLILADSAYGLVASVRERNSGRAKEVFAFGPREKCGKSKKVKGVGEGKKGNACPQTPRF